MPKGLPTASDLMHNRLVTFFSIDTNVIQSLGYKFNEGALRSLWLQRPEWLSIRLTEIVQKEIMSHRMEPVAESIDELASSMVRAQRLSGFDMSELHKVISELPLAKTAIDRFVEEFDQFMSKLNGEVLLIDGPELARQIFERYFSERPPFEARKEKKFEFPDAAALLVLEAYAQKMNTKGILISKDGGWSAFAHESDFLYCVNSLDDFVALFESVGESAEVVKTKLRLALQDADSGLVSQIESELTGNVEGAFWRVDDVYCGYSLRVDADVFAIAMDGFDLDSDQLSLWFVEHDPTLCTVELTATVRVSLDVSLDFYQYDTIDHDEQNVASDQVERAVEIEINIFLTCRADLLRDDVDEWDVSIGLSGGHYRVDIGEVNPDFGDDDDYR